MSITALVLSAYFANPLLMVSQGYVESNMNSMATGKAKEKGAFQVIEKHWGKVPRNIYLQAKQNESIIETLKRESNDNCIWTAIRKYNGQGKKAREYTWKVQKKAIQIAML
jgi:hypothetical protein